MYSGTLSDFVKPWSNGFVKKNNKKAKMTDIDAAVAALASQNPAEEAAKVFDLESFLTFWAMESITDSQDGVAMNRNNHQIYNLNGKFVFLPWGSDSAMGAEGRQQGLEEGKETQWSLNPSKRYPASVMANHALANMLYNDKVWGPKYRQRVRSLVGPGKAFDSAKMLAKIDHLHFLLKPYINIPGIVQSSREDQPRQSPEQFEIAVAGLKGWVKQRPSDVLAVVDTAEWAWPTAWGAEWCRDFFVRLL